MSRRQQILEAVVTRLKTITTNNGYLLQIGTKVFDWKLNPLLPADLPAIEVRDREAPMELINLAGGMSHQLNMDIIIIASGITAAATARKGLEDIVKALQVDRTFGGLVQVYLPKSTSIEMQQDEQLLAAGQFTCELQYYTGPGEI
jgi:hypothetical protein